MKVTCHGVLHVAVDVVRAAAKAARVAVQAAHREGRPCGVDVDEHAAVEAREAEH